MHAKRSWSESPVSALLNTNALVDYPFAFVLIAQVDRTGQQAQTYLYIGVSAQKMCGCVCVASLSCMQSACGYPPSSLHYHGPMEAFQHYTSVNLTRILSLFVKNSSLGTLAYEL